MVIKKIREYNEFSVLFSECGSAWSERAAWDGEVVGSNPTTPIGEEKVCEKQKHLQ